MRRNCVEAASAAATALGNDASAKEELESVFKKCPKQVESEYEKT